jgi:predicted ATPase
MKMLIDRISIENFKGIKDRTTLDLKPITVFIGKNSSGKSSVIHAIGAMSQTFKLPNDNRPLILDDEFANVHLGRFIEVIHSKSYRDSIKIGIEFDKVSLPDFLKDKVRYIESKLTGEFTFKCTKKTQTIFISHAQIQFNGEKYVISGNSNLKYTLTLPNRDSMQIKLGKGFLVDASSFFSSMKTENYAEIVQVFSSFNLIQTVFERSLLQINYLGPFRQPPIRRYPARGSAPREVGAQGESTVTLLANELVQTLSRGKIKQVRKWLDQLKLGENVEVKRSGNTELFDLSVHLDDKSSFPIADLGYGVSQVLPVLTQCAFASDESMLLFEQPEIHLHSSAQSGLAKVFSDVVREKKCKILIETHSEPLLEEFIREISAGNLKHTDFVAYLVERKDFSTHIREIPIDPELNEAEFFWKPYL